MLTGCNNIHGKEVVHRLGVESFRTEVGKRGDSKEALFDLFHGGLFAKNKRSGLDVTRNLEVSSKTTECGFDLVEQFMRDWVLARCSTHVNFGGLQFKVD